MKFVGRAMSTYGNRMLIIQCDAAQLPGLYSEVMDRTTKTVGMITDVFGSVKAPYALVLTRGPCSVRPGEKVFAKAGASPATQKQGFTGRQDRPPQAGYKSGDAGCRKLRNSSFSRQKGKHSNRV